MAFVQFEKDLMLIKCLIRILKRKMIWKGFWFDGEVVKEIDL